MCQAVVKFAEGMVKVGLVFFVYSPELEYKAAVRYCKRKYPPHGRLHGNQHGIGGFLNGNVDTKCSRRWMYRNLDGQVLTDDGRFVRCDVFVFVSVIQDRRWHWTAERPSPWRTCNAQKRRKSSFVCYDHLAEPVTFPPVHTEKLVASITRTAFPAGLLEIYQHGPPKPGGSEVDMKFDWSAVMLTVAAFCGLCVVVFVVWCWNDAVRAEPAG